MKLGAIILVAAIALPGTAAYSQDPTQGSATAKQKTGNPTSKEKAVRIRKGTNKGRAMHSTPSPHQGTGDPSNQHGAPNLDDGEDS